MLNYQGMYLNLAWNCRVCVGAVFLCLSACLPSLATLEWIDQQHFAKTKMGCVSLSSDLNVIVAITSYYCVILKMVILHVAIKQFIMEFLRFFKEQKPVSFQKNEKTDWKKQVGVFSKKTVFSQPWLSFNPFFVIFSWLHDLEQVMLPSIGLGMRRTSGVYVHGIEETKNYWHLSA